MADRLRVTLRRSTVGSKPSARGTVRALGLRRVGHTVEIADDPAVRGQIHAVRHLVDVEAVMAPGGARAAARRKKEAEA